MDRARLVLVTAFLFGFFSFALPAQRAIASTYEMFFGEDQNCSTPNQPPDDPMRLASTPNADGAKAGFFSHLNPEIIVENFESYPVDSRPSSLSFGGMTVDLIGNAPIRSSVAGVNAVPPGHTTYNGVYPISGTQYLVLGGGQTGSFFEIRFPTAQAAFGFFAVDLEVALLTLTFDPDEIDNGNETTITVPYQRGPLCANGMSNSGGVIYFGVIDVKNPFRRIKFANGDAALDGFGFDDMVIGSPLDIQPPLCGNGVVDPDEQCDLGAANCPDMECCASGCTSNCRVTGLCTGSDVQVCCVTASGCASGQGCCGNGIIESGEQCDDGNTVDGDCCSHACQVEPLPCPPIPDVCAGTFGPHLISNPTIKKTTLSQSRTSPGGLDGWKASGQFSLQDGQTIDPDAEIVGYTLSQNNGANQSTNLYAPVLDPAACPNGRCFKPTTNPQGLDTRWRFRLTRTAPDITGAPGWRAGTFSRTARQPNLIHFLLSGRNAAVGTPQSVNSIRRVRQSIKIGDDCVTRALDCTPNNARTRFTCKEAHCGNGIKDRGEQCGEPSLPACVAGKVCDTCVCVPGP